MKLGTENRNKTIFAGVLLAIALLLVLRGYFGNAPQPAAAPAAVQTQAQPQRRARRRGSNSPRPANATLDPRLQLGLLKQAESTSYEGLGRDIFRAHVEPPPRPVAPVITTKNNTPPPPQVYTPPPPPPINL